MTSPEFDPSQQYTQADPMGAANPAGYTAENPYRTPGAYGQPPPYGQPPSYGQPPPYGQPPGYGPPPAYGQPAQYPPPMYGYPVMNPASETNTMAILALVFAFIVAPLGIVFGHMARSQIRQRPQQGDGLALAGLILGYIFTVVLLAYCAFIGILIKNTCSNGLINNC